NKCGHVNRTGKREDLLWTCDGCGEGWDQDENAAKNLLRTAEIANGERL
ncbi:MAG: zinc ribbon domain-containing protein, partial [Leptospirillia bacterium]